MEVMQVEGSSGSSLSSISPELDKVAPFLIKLFEIVSSPASDDLVCWSEHGETPQLMDALELCQRMHDVNTLFMGDSLTLQLYDSWRARLRQALPLPARCRRRLRLTPGPRGRGRRRGWAGRCRSSRAPRSR